MARRAKVVVIGATAVLLALVVAVRDGTAVDEAALRPEPSTAHEPSAAPRQDDPRVLLLDANGVPGLRLGTHVPTARRVGGELPDGTVLPCEQAAPGPPAEGTPRHPVLSSGEYDVGGWVQDGVLTAVRVATWDQPAGTVDDIASWAGVTIGSPVSLATEMPGATTAVHRPFGADGPRAVVVRVPVSRGRQLVVGAVERGGPPTDGTDTAVTADPVTARVTSLEVRDPAARECTLEPVLQWYLGPAFPGPGGEGFRLRTDPARDAAVVRLGDTSVRLGGGSEQLATAGFSTRPGPADGEDGCRSWVHPAGATATTTDGVVTMVSSTSDTGRGTGGSTASRLPVRWDDLGVGSRDSVRDAVAAVERVLGEDALRWVPSRLDGLPVTVRVSGRVAVDVAVAEDVRLVDDLDLPLFGDDGVVHGLTVQRLTETGTRYRC